MHNNAVQVCTKYMHTGIVSSRYQSSYTSYYNDKRRNMYKFCFKPPNSCALLHRNFSEHVL